MADNEKIVRSDEEIEETMAKAIDASHKKSQYPGMSYEKGVADALRWLLEEDENNPMED